MKKEKKNECVTLTNNGNKLFTSFMASCHSNRQGKPDTEDHVIEINIHQKLVLDK